MVDAPALILGPAIAFGLIIGLYEVLLIHRDVHVPMHRFSHSIHAIVLAVLFVLITMNTQYFLDLFPSIASIALIGNVHILRAVIGFIAMVKIHGVSRAISASTGMTRGLGETWFHSILIGALITAAPYAYDLFNLAQYMPVWLLW